MSDRDKYLTEAMDILVRYKSNGMNAAATDVIASIYKAVTKYKEGRGC